MLGPFGTSELASVPVEKAHPTVGGGVTSVLSFVHSGNTTCWLNGAEMSPRRGRTECTSMANGWIFEWRVLWIDLGAFEWVPPRREKDREVEQVGPSRPPTPQRRLGNRARRGRSQSVSLRARYAIAESHHAALLVGPLIRHRQSFTECEEVIAAFCEPSPTCCGRLPYISQTLCPFEGSCNCPQQPCPCRQAGSSDWQARDELWRLPSG